MDYPRNLTPERNLAFYPFIQFYGVPMKRVQTHRNQTTFARWSFLLLIALILPSIGATHPHEAQKQVAAAPAASKQCSTDIAELTSTQAIIARLCEGNQRFVKNQMHGQNFATERKELANGQKPYAIVLTCADSRVPPEIVFDEELGHLFVVRVAGNVVDPAILGSIEYAAEHLGAKTLIIMGHEKCGAVKAACDHAHVTPNIDLLINSIAPAVVKAEKNGNEKNDLVHNAVQENVRLQMKRSFEQSATLLELVEHHQLEVVGAVYDLETGVVNWLMPEKNNAHKGETAEANSH